MVKKEIGWYAKFQLNLAYHRSVRRKNLDLLNTVKLL